jgi:hypothetical protein
LEGVVLSSPDLDHPDRLWRGNDQHQGYSGED